MICTLSEDLGQGDNSLRCCSPVHKNHTAIGCRGCRRPLLQGLFLDLLSSGEYLLGSAKVDISGSEIFQGFMVALVVVYVNRFTKIAW